MIASSSVSYTGGEVICSRGCADVERARLLHQYALHRPSADAERLAECRPCEAGGLIRAANERETDNGATDPRDLAARIVTSMSRKGLQNLLWYRFCFQHIR